jgi:hypothetical protein
MVTQHAWRIRISKDSASLGALRRKPLRAGYLDSLFTVWARAKNNHD